MLGQGVQNRPAHRIPIKNIPKLVQNEKLLNKIQNNKINSDVHSSKELVITPNEKQRGGFLGPLLASIA